MTEKPTVVVIDDQDYVNMTIKIALSNWFAIHSFTSVESVTAYLETNPTVHGFIVDYHISIESGLLLAKNTIRRLYPKTPCILVSAFYNDTIPTVDQSEIHTYFNDTLTKPFDVNVLQEKAKRLFLQ